MTEVTALSNMHPEKPPPLSFTVHRRMKFDEFKWKEFLN
jgi:hypothetical protein